MYFAYGIFNCARNLTCPLLISICKTQKKGNSPLLDFLIGLFKSMDIIIFLNTFYIEIHQNNIFFIFLFFKSYF